MRAAHATSDAPPSAARVHVLVPVPLGEVYDYRLPEGCVARPGSFVSVPFGRRQMIGVVWDEQPSERPSPEESSLKEVTTELDCPAMPSGLRRLVDWVAGYTLSPRGAVLRMAMSVPKALEPPAPRIAYALGDRPAKRLTKARQRVLALAAEGPPRGLTELAREAAVGAGVVCGLAKAGALKTLELPAARRFSAPDWRRAGATFSPEQAAAAVRLKDRARQGGFATMLLDGVTGAGKTEVYLDAAAGALERDRQVLVLLPEIALGAQWLEHFRRRFAVTHAEWHSDLGARQRRETWRAVATGEARVVVGARSGLFLPFAELGLIVVDEEHDAAFKQEDGVIYNARDMAIVRARLEDIPCVLVSATPSLETVVNVQQGRYERLHLPARHAGAALPEISAIDMRAENLASGSWLSGTLLDALVETLESGQQAMLFLNRRGYAPLTLCRTCGHRLHCPNCTSWLVEHRAFHHLQCHHCGHREALPERCPNCDGADSFAACGPGVERLAEEAGAKLPGARIAIAASDTLNGPKAAAALVRRILEEQVNLVIGTQILAKGHHFPMLTLVGVVDADLGLAGGDLRAAERTYQLLHQVAGRAGRGAHPGRVLLQTYMPDHPVMGALISGERDRFLEEEAAARRKLGLPPFGRLAGIIVSGRDEGAVATTARELARRAPRQDGLSVLGPAPAPLSRLGGRHRWRLLVKARKDVALQAALRHWLAETKPARGVKLKVDIDPYSFL